MKIKSEKYRLTVLIPIYNEFNNIAPLHLELQNFLKVASVKTKILFVDDGSNDNSLQQIVKLCKDCCDYQWIALEHNSGISTALKAGIDTVDTEFVGYMDADLQTLPIDFNLLLRHADQNALVTGSRVVRNDSFIKRLSSRIANRIRRLFTGDGISDTGCPLKIIETKFAKGIPWFRGMHRFLPALIQLQGGTVKQIPIKHYPRTSGQSKFTVGNRILSTFVDCFAFLWLKKRYISYNLKQRKS